MVLQQVLAYATHLLSALALLGAFVAVYLHVTPYRELQLIRQGCVAAALSLGGAVGGFALTLASSITHNDHYLAFAVWALLSALVQLATYLVMARIFPNMNAALESDNRAMGTLMGTFALVVGLLNAACLS